MAELGEYVAGLMGEAEKDKKLLGECEEMAEGDIKDNLVVLHE